MNAFALSQYKWLKKAAEVYPLGPGSCGPAILQTLELRYQWVRRQQNGLLYLGAALESLMTVLRVADRASWRFP